MRLGARGTRRDPPEKLRYNMGFGDIDFGLQVIMPSLHLLPHAFGGALDLPAQLRRHLLLRLLHLNLRVLLVLDVTHHRHRLLTHYTHFPTQRCPYHVRDARQASCVLHRTLALVHQARRAGQGRGRRRRGVVESSQSHTGLRFLAMYTIKSGGEVVVAERERWSVSNFAELVEGVAVDEEPVGVEDAEADDVFDALGGGCCLE